MPIGTFFTTATLALAATASGTLTHGLATTPHAVWGTAKLGSAAHASASLASPYLTLAANSASVSAYNRGQIAETWTIHALFAHSIIK